MDVGATSVTNISRRRWTPGTHGRTPRTGEFSSRSMSSADRSEPDMPSATKAVTEPMINPRNAAASTITTGEVDADFAVVALTDDLARIGLDALQFDLLEVVFVAIWVWIVWMRVSGPVSHSGLSSGASSRS